MRRLHIRNASSRRANHKKRFPRECPFELVQGILCSPFCCNKVQIFSTRPGAVVKLSSLIVDTCPWYFFTRSSHSATTFSAERTRKILRKSFCRRTRNWRHILANWQIADDFPNKRRQSLIGCQRRKQMPRRKGKRI